MTKINWYCLILLLGFSGVDTAYADNVRLFPVIATISAVCSSSGTNATVGRVYYATDREQNIKAKGPSERFGAQRSKQGKIYYGSCEVSIPTDHRMGELDDGWWRRLCGKPSIEVLDVKIREKDPFFSELADRIKKSPGKNLFIFIHGYSVSFDEAARRTAQMAYDLKFEGAPIFFSWPSKGSYPSYLSDTENVKWSKSHLKTFISDVVAKSDANNIYLIAHSMGNRALIEAYSDLVSEKPALSKRFREIILAAPDIDAAVFKDQIAPKIMNLNTITLYVSTKDRALQLSQGLNENPRLGNIIDPEILKYRWIETIDATGVDSIIGVGHSYYADSKTVLSDIYYLIKENLRPQKRFTLDRKGEYWKFRK